MAEQHRRSIAKHTPFTYHTGIQARYGSFRVKDTHTNSAKEGAGSGANVLRVRVPPLYYQTRAI